MSAFASAFEGKVDTVQPAKDRRRGGGGGGRVFVCRITKSAYSSKNSYCNKVQSVRPSVVRVRQMHIRAITAAAAAAAAVMEVLFFFFSSSFLASTFAFFCHSRISIVRLRLKPEHVRVRRQWRRRPSRRRRPRRSQRAACETPDRPLWTACYVVLCGATRRARRNCVKCRNEGLGLLNKTSPSSH